MKTENHPNRTYSQVIPYGQIVVTDKHGISTTALFDVEDTEVVSSHNWYITNGRLATKTKNGKQRIHEIITRTCTDDNLCINHIDNNPLNNKKSNLELVTNQFNSALQSKKSNLPVGVSHQGNSFELKLRDGSSQVSFCSKDTQYLRSIHHHVYTRSLIVTRLRYAQIDPSFVPLSYTVLLARLTPAHLIKFEFLCKATFDRQSSWYKKVYEAGTSPDATEKQKATLETYRIHWKNLSKKL
jgi:hypothetical protein